MAPLSSIIRLALPLLLSISYITDAFFTEKYFGPAENNKTLSTKYDQSGLIAKMDSIPSKTIYLGKSLLYSPVFILLSGIFH